MARIHILAPETSRLIAAGEVIDRPASALRELIDNAIDAGASEIRVDIEKGGIDLIRVSDDGDGMSREDLLLSILEHATSKIENADDLLVARTLGFRGEALASIAAVARLEITSREPSAEMGWRLGKELGKDAVMDPVAARAGTTVSVRGIFERFPARRQFLKRPASEALLCRQVFVERAAAHPSIAFVWNSGAQSEHFTAAAQEERIAALYQEIPGRILSRFATEVEGCAFTAIYADPSFHRKDRKYLQVFVNRRRVPEWGFMSVLEYAFADYLPGGMKPCAFLFVEIDPAQADFNIHPAKREVRLKNPEPLKSGFHAAFLRQLRSALGAGPSDMSAGSPEPMPLPGFRRWQESAGSYSQGITGGQAGRAFWDRLSAEAKVGGGGWAGESPHEPSPPSGPGVPHGSGALPAFRYLGRGFGPFLIFELDDVLYVLDQHAAHERILYDELSGAMPASQPLLVPFVFEGEAEGFPRRLAHMLPELRRMGYEIEADGDGMVVNAIPSFLGEKGIPALVGCLSEDSKGDEVARGVVATMACKAAIKDGDILDDFAARELIAKALALPFPRCPHGRPIWAKFDRTALYRMVGRITS